MVVLLILLILLIPVVALLVVIPLGRHRDPAGRAQALRNAGFGWTVAFVALAVLWITGETTTDPGGWTALALVAGWLVPMGVTAVLYLLAARFGHQAVAAPRSVPS